MLFMLLLCDIHGGLDPTQAAAATGVPQHGSSKAPVEPLSDPAWRGSLSGIIWSACTALCFSLTFQQVNQIGFGVLLA